MLFGQFSGILDEEPFNLLCMVDVDVISSKWLPSCVTDLLSYHMWLYGCKTCIGNLLDLFLCPFPSAGCSFYWNELYWGHTVHYLISGWDCWKNYQKTRGNTYLSELGISLVPHSNLNSIHYSPFTLGTILTDRRSLFTVTSIPIFQAPFALYILFHTRSTFKLAHVLINTLKRPIRQAFSKYFV